jgi:plastocyanin
LYALVSGGGAAHGNADFPNGVYAIGEAGAFEPIVDLGAWLLANPVASDPPADFDPEGTFFGMVAAGDALWVVESNSEQVLRVTAEGDVSRIADLSAEDQVPTAITAAPDGGVYVGMFTSAPHPSGGATVAWIAEDGGITTVWSGLTAVTGVAVGPDGVLYATQLAETRDRPPFFNLASGSIVRQTGEAGVEPVLTGLNLPVALRFGPDGALYASGPAIGASQGAGYVLRVDPAASGIALDLSALTAPDCGGAGGAGDGTEGASGIDDQPAPTAVSDGTGGSDAGGTGAGQSGGGGSTSEIVVRIFDYGFEPPLLTIPAGSTVIWANTGAVAHTVTGTLNGEPAWDSGEITPGGLYSFTFAEPGTYDYVCTLHPEMAGTIIVE